MEDTLKHFGQKIEQQREKLSLTQIDLAALCGVSDLTIRNIERGNTGTALGNWIKAANAVGLSFDLTIKRMSDEKRESI